MLLICMKYKRPTIERVIYLLLINMNTIMLINFLLLISLVFLISHKLLKMCLLHAAFYHRYLQLCPLLWDFRKWYIRRNARLAYTKPAKRFETFMLLKIDKFLRIKIIGHVKGLWNRIFCLHQIRISTNIIYDS